MKKTIYLSLVLFIAFFLSIDNIYAQEDPTLMENYQTPATAIDSTPVRFVEDMPEFPGGNKEFSSYLKKEMKYPENCRIKGIQGVVIIEFVVEKNGKVTHVKAVTKVDPELDAEAVRVIQNSPDWKPGKQMGKPVRVFYTIPIRFSLN
jgi:periplasmic protein TonB